jgi:predicted membrane protein
MPLTLPSSKPIHCYPNVYVFTSEVVFLFHNFHFSLSMHFTDAMRPTYASHSITTVFIIRMIYGKQIVKLLIMQCHPVFYHFLLFMST